MGHLRIVVLVLTFLVAGVIPSMAVSVYTIPPESPSYLINPSATGVDVLEAFIQTPGVSFGSPGFVNLDSGWNDRDINPRYSLEYGPLSAQLTEDLNLIVSPSVSSPIAINLYAFTGCASLQPVSTCPVQDLTDAYQVTFDHGAYQGWTPLTAANLSVENTTASTPEPTTILLIGVGLISLIVRRQTTIRSTARQVIPIAR